MTETEYYLNLARVRELNPGEVFLPTLEAGYSRVNCVYMQTALDRLPGEYDEQPEAETDAEAEETERPDDPQWNALTRSIRECYNEVRRVHNQYFTCKTEADFVRVATQMQGAWEATQTAINNRKAYENGVVAYEPEDEIPDNPVQLGKMLNSLRAKRTQHQAKILELAKKGAADKVKAKEASLLKIKNLILIVEAKLKDYEHQEVL